MGTLLQDIRFGSRMLLRNPGVTLVAVLCLAIGIGATTSVYSVVNAVLLSPLPYKDPNRLTMVWMNNLELGLPEFNMSLPDFRDLQSQNRSFESVAAMIGSPMTVISDSEPERVSSLWVSPGFFELLGTGPAMGRAFAREDYDFGAGRAAAIVLTHGYWQRRFGGDPEVIGEALRVGALPATIVGVMPPDFTFLPLRDLGIIAPLPLDLLGWGRGQHLLSVLARLKEGTTFDAAQVDLDVIAQRIEKEYPGSNTGWGMGIEAIRDHVVGDVRPGLLLILGTVGFVLLIACANVVNLLLVLGAQREREMALRAALGAGRWRILRQLVTEGLLLALAGGSLGLVCAVWGTSAASALMPSNVPRVGEIRIDLGVFFVTLAIVLVIGVTVSIFPAVHGFRLQLHQSLKEATTQATSGAASRRIREILVGAEVAFALMLMVGAGLMARSFLELLRVDPGFNPENALVMEIAKTGNAPAFFRELETRIEGLPGVEAAGAISHLPLSGFTNEMAFNGELAFESELAFNIVGRPAAPPPGLNAGSRTVTRNFFRAMEMPLLKGRFFDERDRADTGGVIIINEALARRHWTGEDPLGRYIAARGRSIEIVGVVGDVRDTQLGAAPQPTVYFPHEQADDPMGGAGFARTMRLVVRTVGDPLGIAPAIRQEIRDVDSATPVRNIETLDTIVRDSTSIQWLIALLTSTFAAVASVLAAVGIYGVMACTVAQRTHEIGIRMALGAQRRDILGLVLRQGLKLFVAGAGIGLLAAFALRRVLDRLLYGISALDPLTFVSMPILLAFVVLLACGIPALRALKLSPVIALHEE